MHREDLKGQEDYLIVIARKDLIYYTCFKMRHLVYGIDDKKNHTEKMWTVTELTNKQ